MDAYDALRSMAPQKFAYHFHRLEMYARRDSDLIPLYRLGEELTQEELPKGKTE